MAKTNLALAKSEFEDKQMQALDVNRDANSDVLKQAKEIGLITDSVIQKIKDSKVQDKLEGAFHAALRNSEKNMDSAKAFRTAFKTVYGRFLLEQESTDDLKGSPVFTKLNGVLKFEIDDHGLKGRPELQAALSKLQEYAGKAQQPERVNVADEKKSLAKKIEAVKKHLVIFGGVDGLTTAVDSYSNNYVDTASIKADLQQIDSDLYYPNLQLKTLNGKLKVDGVSDREVSDFFVAMSKCLADNLDEADREKFTNTVFALGPKKLDILLKRMGTDRIFARKLLGIDPNKNLTEEDVAEASKRLMSIFHTDRFFHKFGIESKRFKMAELTFKLVGAAVNTLEVAIKSSNLGPVEDFFGERDDLVKTVNDLQEKKRLATNDLDEKKAKNAEAFRDASNVFSEFRDVISNMNIDAGVSNAAKALCATFLQDYNDWRSGPNAEDATLMKHFFETKLQPFLQLLKSDFDADLETSQDELNNIASKVGEFDKKLGSLAGTEALLAKAFPATKSGAEMKGFERLHEEAVGKQKQVKDTYEYFAHHHNLEVFLESQNSYAKIVGGTDKLGTGGEFYAKRAEARRNFEVTDKALKDLYEPTDSSIERTLAEMAKSHRASGNKADFDATGARQRLINDYTTRKEKYTTQIVSFEEDKDVYDNIFEHATKLHAETKKLVQNLEAAAKLKIPFEGGFDAEALVEKFKTFEPKSRSFNPIDFLTYSAELQTYFSDHHKVEHLQKAFDAKLADSEKGVKTAKKVLDKEKAIAESGKHLTDAQAAKKIIGEIVAEQFPLMAIEERDKLCVMILADDVTTLQVDDGYLELAQRGSAQVLNTVERAGELKIRGKLLAFQYKEGGNVVTPFKGLKPESFKDWASIEKLFERGILNNKNGFFLLAALEIFDQENGGVPSIQTRRTEDKLRMLLAKQLGVHERMDVAGVNKIVNDAFKAQIEKVRPLVKAHFELYGSKGEEAKDYKRQVLEMKYEELTDKLRTGKINSDIFALKVKGLAKEATEADIDDVNFSQDTALAGFWHSKESQWLRDKGVDVAKFAGKKALGLAVMAPTKIAFKGLWGATKLGTGLGFQAAALPFRIAKYPLLLGAKPLVGAINLFRKAPISLTGIRDSINNDVARTLGYAGSTIKGNFEGAKAAVTGTSAAEWNAVKFTHEKYADRTKDKAALREEKMKMYGEKATLEAVETAVSPFIDLAEYKGKIEQLDKLLGTTTHFPADTAKAGHTEAIAHKKEESHAPAAANDDHAKHDDHGHDKAHGAHH